MAEFHVRSDSVDVEQIMRQIRARIREKRGADYTEAELQQLASVKLEKFLDPRGVRSDLVEQFRKHRVVSEPPPNYAFEDTTLYETHRAPLRWIRALLKPILKLFFNPDKITSALHIQAKVNEEFHRRFRQREEMDPLYYEVVHNLVLEVTRLGIEVHNLKMRVESLSSRMDFDERRARSLEGVVQYRAPRDRGPQRPSQGPSQDNQRTPRHVPAPQPAQHAAPGPGQQAPPAQAAGSEPVTEGRDDAAAAQAASGEAGAPAEAAAGISNGRAFTGSRPEGRRRRRRRRRRPGQTFADTAGGAGAAAGSASSAAAGAGPTSFGGQDAGQSDDDGPDEGGDDDRGDAE